MTATLAPPATIWICPPPQPLAPAEVDRATELYKKIGRLRARPAGLVGVAGLEVQAALMLLEKRSDLLSLLAPDNQFWRAKCESLLLRPAMEPIACSYWPRFRSFDFDADVCLKIASALAGRPLVYRRGPAVGKSVRGDVGFEPLDLLAGWLNKLLAAAKHRDLRTALPMFSFAQVIMAHPFGDGNGRFARAMIHASLAYGTGLDRPELALAPAFYLRAETMAAALRGLSNTGDWSAFNAAFLSVLEASLKLTQALHQKRGR